MRAGAPPLAAGQTQEPAGTELDAPMPGNFRHAVMAAAMTSIAATSTSAMISI
jgi:hypothetical protein